MPENENGPILCARDLRREYPTPGEPLVVLRGVSFKLARGESMSIMGPSGCGKSTLLHILGTLDPPTAGSVELNGQDPASLAAGPLAAFRNSNVGFVFQDHHLLPQCNVLENVLIPTLVGKHDAEAVGTRARDLLERVGLGQRLTHRPGELSGGERQRVAVARAMINAPPVLLCDEPTGNLDRKSAESIGELFTRLRDEEKTSLVVVTHSHEFAAKFDRRYELLDGVLGETA